MYPKYFGLKEPSFSIAPDPHYLFLSEQHKEALAHLLYGAGESGGFVLLTGEVGTGKTTVCRAFLEQLPEGVDVALIVNPAMTANELLHNICDEFRIPVPEGERSVKLLVDRLNRFLLEAHANGRRPMLLIDEAQNLRPKVMEQVRLLTNLETTKHKLLQIFLVGQPELRLMLEREGLRQINQRITARCHLRPLRPAETADYIRHRVAVAGVDRPLFTAAAVRRIHQVSGGVPRVVNILCDRALLGACVSRSNQVTPAIVAKAAREVQGERLEIKPPAAVRPAFAAAAALALLLVAGWMSYGWLQGDPRELIAAALERAAGPGAPAQTGAADLVAGVPDATEVPLASGGPEIQGLPESEGPAPAGEGLAAAAQLAALPGAGEPGIDSAGGPSPVPAPVPVPVSAPVSAPVPASVAAAVPAPVSVPALAAAAPEELPRVSLASFAPDAAEETLARLAMPEGTALRVLLRRWGVVVQDLGAGDACAGVAAFGLRCEREQGKLSNVRFFDRPVLLRVADRDRVARYAVLGALDQTYGTLDTESGSELVPVAGLEAVWTGDYLVVWQPPPTGAALIGPGASADSVRWLRRIVSEIPGSGLAYIDSGRFDRTLGAALQEFQSARGLAPDGIAGPRTLIQINNAVAMPGIPRLMPRPVTAEVAGVDAVRRAQAAVQGAPGLSEGRGAP